MLLLLLRGLSCPFCRRHISQLRSACDLLQGAGIAMLGVVIASAERSRFYFRFGHSPCFPVAAAPDRSVHRAYGLPAAVLTPEVTATGTQRAAELLREMNINSGDDPFTVFHHYGGWKDTAELNKQRVPQHPSASHPNTPPETRPRTCHFSRGVCT